jgi:heat shock protein HtpX
MKRIVLFVLTNVAVLAVLTIVLKVFGLDRVAAQEGFAVGARLAISAGVGVTGANISLQL